MARSYTADLSTLRARHGLSDGRQRSDDEFSIELHVRTTGDPGTDLLPQKIFDEIDSTASLVYARLQHPYDDFTWDDDPNYAVVLVSRESNGQSEDEDGTCYAIITLTWGIPQGEQRRDLRPEGESSNDPADWRPKISSTTLKRVVPAEILEFGGAAEYDENESLSGLTACDPISLSFNSLARSSGHGLDLPIGTVHPIVNTAGRPFDPAPEIDRSDTMIQYTVYRRINLQSAAQQLGTPLSFTSVSFTDNAPNADTIALSGGSWTGVSAGDKIKVSSANNPSNNGTYRVNSISGSTATLSLQASLATDAGDTGVTIRKVTQEAYGYKCYFDTCNDQDVTISIPSRNYNETFAARSLKVDSVAFNDETHQWKQPGRTATFDASLVNGTLETIPIALHGFLTGQPVVYSDGGGSPIGLSDGATYYVIVVDLNTIQLATSSIGAAAGVPIDLTPSGGSEPNHSLKASNGLTVFMPYFVYTYRFVHRQGGWDPLVFNQGDEVRAEAGDPDGLGGTFGILVDGVANHRTMTDRRGHTTKGPLTLAGQAWKAGQKKSSLLWKLPSTDFTDTQFGLHDGVFMFVS